VSLRPAATAGWGLFAACSWTWCIGMYLPVILLDDFGWPGFLVFAVPNVLGCAAFGYAWRADRATAETQRHAPAMVLFSFTCCAFHVFFAGWAVTLVTGNDGGSVLGPLGASIGLWVAGVAVSLLPPRAWLAAAVAVYAVSAGVFLKLGLGGLRAQQWSGALPVLDLLGVAPAIVLGFLLCPYLDLTFHRALRESPSRHAFAVFGLAFTVMLLLTADYAPTLARGVVAVHLVTQSIFTVGAHLREIREAGWPRAGGGRATLVIAPLLGAIVAVPPLAGEAMYLRFLGPFGLIFPAYVLWYVAAGRVPGWGSTTLFVIAMALLLPCYEVAFVHRVTWLTLIPVAVVLGKGCVRVRRGSSP